MIEKVKDWILALVFLMMVLFGMFTTALKGEVEEDDE